MEFYFGFTVVVAAVWLFMYRAFYSILSLLLRTRTVLSLCRVSPKERKKYTLMLGCWGLCKHVIDRVWCKGKQMRSPNLTWLALNIGVGRCIVSAPTHIKVLLYYCIISYCVVLHLNTESASRMGSMQSVANRKRQRYRQRDRQKQSYQQSTK